jgi:hypothetical protein
MSSIDNVREHMQVIDAEGTPLGKVDKVEGDRIKLTRDSSSAGSGEHEAHHHFIPAGLVADIEGDTVRLSAKIDAIETNFVSEEDGSPA